MTRYKFRAERQKDAEQLFSLMETASLAVSIISITGLEYEIETDLSGEMIQEYMSEVEDSHVMIRTLATPENYSGIENMDVDFERMGGNLFYFISWTTEKN